MIESAPAAEAARAALFDDAFPIAPFFAATLTAYLGAALVARNARALGLVSAPNHRSSHKAPTPHGGGAGIVVAGIAAMVWCGAALSAGPAWWAVTALAALIAAFGLWDDIAGVSARLRLLAQAAGAGGLVLAAGPPPLPLGGGVILAGPALALLLTLAIVWWVNLFNFMDGIDGIAGAQGLFMAGAALVALSVYSPAAHAAGAWTAASILAAALSGGCVGFLLLNWPPARIFMGDVGATFLAYAVAVLALASIQAGVMTYPAWAALAAVFISDATVTLLRRARRGQRLHEAHRSHAYQRLSRRWGGHQPVTLGALAINLFWVAPIAFAALSLGPAPDAAPAAWALAALAYLPLVIGALRVGAGRPDDA